MSAILFIYVICEALNIIYVAENNVETINILIAELIVYDS
jgi:hypothetical protein